MATPVYVIIVSHDSSAVLATCLNHLDKQTIAARQVIVVDCGSTDPSYLRQLPEVEGLRLVNAENIGYGRGNNLGCQQLEGAGEGMVVFLNPDTFLPHDFLAQAVTVLTENPGAGAISGKLLGYDHQAMKPTGRIDSTGIYRRWYGRWYDRGQGEKDRGQYDLIDSPPALCGALLCCRQKALQPYGREVFDPDFFLYKEDIELCLRLRRDGWGLVYDPRLVAFHCRGWGSRRSLMSHALRLTAAQSELLLCRKHPGPHILWAWSKYLLVRLFHL